MADLSNETKKSRTTWRNQLMLAGDGFPMSLRIYILIATMLKAGALQ